MSRPPSLQVPPDGEPYDYFRLKTNTPVPDGLLPEEHELVVDRKQRHITLVNWEIHRFQASARFTRREFPIILALIEAWPKACPYAHLLSIFTNEPEEAISRRVDAWNEALDQQALKQAIAPVHSLFMASQKRLRGLEVQAGVVYGHGYILRPSSARYDYAHPLITSAPHP